MNFCKSLFLISLLLLNFLSRSFLNVFPLGFEESEIYLFWFIRFNIGEWISGSDLMFLCCFLGELVINILLIYLFLRKGIIFGFIWSGGTTPTRLKRSVISPPLTLRSSFSLHWREGERLTSNSQGFKF